MSVSMPVLVKFEIVSRERDKNSNNRPDQSSVVLRRVSLCKRRAKQQKGDKTTWGKNSIRSSPSLKINEGI